MHNASHSSIQSHGLSFQDGNDPFFVKGITYGPFTPNVDDEPFPSQPQTLRDLDRIRHLGFNTVRIYHVAPPWFLDACEERNLKVLQSIPWMDHVDLFQKAALREAATRNIIEAVEKTAAHPALFAYLVGNELSSTLVRWMGPRRTQAFLEGLILSGKKTAPNKLFSYSNYPTTEYLTPGNTDFLAFNIYLENPDAFERYLRRLQNLAATQPLLITEFGADGNRVNQETLFDWHWKICASAGIAGSTWFSYTDEWFRGGEEVTEWAFGIVDRERQEKPVATHAREVLNNLAIPLIDPPKVSIIVCTYNGSRTLKGCLESLTKIAYPDLEVIVVDDGSSEDIERIVEPFSFRFIKLERGGLSLARNVGAAAAEGDIFVYTDDDCMATPDWLTHLVNTFEDAPDIGAVGGPNIPPQTDDFIPNCVARAPGAPAHVLLSDDLAEHIPGCNLAVRREAFEAIGGFEVLFRIAGDDVDFCWRLRDAGYEIGFHPAAWVWHHRRFSFRTYYKQQMGYGTAEALLLRKHPNKFGPLGGAGWSGMVYQPTVKRKLAWSPRIYQGVFGQAPFQFIYSGPQGHLLSLLGCVVSSYQWFLAALCWLLLSLAFSWALPLSLSMLMASIANALIQTLRTRLPEKRPLLSAFTVFLMHLTQPILRGASRSLGPWKHGNPPRDSLVANFILENAHRRARQISFWSEEGVDRTALLNQINETPFEHHSRNTGWNRWDLEVGGNPFWLAHVATVTEYHGGKDMLTRVRISIIPTTRFIALFLLAAICCIAFYQFFPILGVLATGGLIAFRITAGIRYISLKTRVCRRIMEAAKCLALTPNDQ